MTDRPASPPPTDEHLSACAFEEASVRLRLAELEGESLVSRLEARRLAERLARFKHVALDFAGVTFVGQALADELFRVFAREHPSIRMVPVNGEPVVAQMIRRAAATAAQEGQEASWQ